MGKGIVLTVIALALTGPALLAAPPAVRPYAANRFGLELDGTFVGFVTKVEGGNVVGQVVKQQPTEDIFVKKHLSNAGVRDIALEFGGDMHEALYAWMKVALQRQQVPKSGAVLSIDAMSSTVRSRLDFTNAQITQVTFPTLDATSKDAARFSIRLTPETTSLSRSGGGKAPIWKGSAQKATLASGFRLAIDGLDMTGTSKVEALTINLPLSRDTLGDFRDYNKSVAPIDVPNVIVTLSEARAESVYDWLESFVIKGNNADDAEKNGTLEYLSTTLGKTLFQITFKQLGIVEIVPVAAEANADAIAKVMVEMYCEQIVFEPVGIN